MCKMIQKLFLILSFFVIATSAFADVALNASGNYLYEKLDRLVLSFPEKGVVQFRRYSGSYSKSGMTYRSEPSESTWAPYTTSGKNSAKALICQYMNPKSHCSAKTIKVEGNIINWGPSTIFKKTNKKFKKFRGDKKPFTYKRLTDLYRDRMSLIK